MFLLLLACSQLPAVDTDDLWPGTDEACALLGSDQAYLKLCSEVTNDVVGTFSYDETGNLILTTDDGVVVRFDQQESGIVFDYPAFGRIHYTNNGDCTEEGPGGSWVLTEADRDFVLLMGGTAPLAAGGFEVESTPIEASCDEPMRGPDACHGTPYRSPLLVRYGTDEMTLQEGYLEHLGGFVFRGRARWFDLPEEPECENGNQPYTMWWLGSREGLAVD